MSASPRLQLPLLAPAQAQKHVTHNEALMRLDALAQLGVVSQTVAIPPASPAEGASYIVPAAASGAWSGKSTQIARWQDGAWIFVIPQDGWRAWVSDTAKLRVFQSGVWTLAQSDQVDQLGVNAAANATRRLTVASDMTLLSAATSDHRLTVNKTVATDTASLVFQTGYSGRAEMGLPGEDNFRIKVSPDGTVWRDALAIDRTTGRVSMPLTSNDQSRNLLINAAFQINQRQFAGGTLAANIYGFDRWKAGASGANISLSGQTLTLNSGQLVQIVDPAVFVVATLASTQLTFSVEDLSGASMQVDVGGQSATISPGAGRRSVTITLPPSATGTVAVALSSAAGAISFSRPKLETGSQATAWNSTPAPLELALCQYFYFEMSAEFIAPGVIYDAYTDNANAYAPVTIPFPSTMRAAPAASWAGTLTPTNILLADQPIAVQTSLHCAVIRPRGIAAGRRTVTCTTGARMKLSAEY